MITIRKRLISIGVAAALLTTALAGCAGGKKGGAEAGDSEDKAAMGRYMEEEIKFPEELASIDAIGSLEDGSVRVVGGVKQNSAEKEGASETKGVWDSKDEGNTWVKAFDFPDEVKGEGKYSTSIAVSPNGELGAIFMSYQDKSYSFEYYIINGTEVKELKVTLEQNTPDGSEASESSSEQEPKMENSLSSMEFSDTGELFATDSMGNVLRLDKETGEIKQTYRGPGDYVVGFVVVGDTLIVSSDSKVVLYNIETGESLPEDTNLNNQIFQNTEKEAGAVSSLSAIVFQSDKEAKRVYFCNNQGLYSHALDGSISEQIIDGALNSMGNPSAYLIGLAAMKSDQFMLATLVEEKPKLFKYTYSKNTPAKPSTEIKVYSLNENIEIRQAIATYQNNNPDVFIQFEVGLSGEDGATVSDALRTLNTDIIAGKGPDILIMDGMPIQSYIEKGLLANLSETLKPIGDADGFFESMINTYSGDGSIFAVPSRFLLPVLQGDAESVKSADNIKGLADRSEQFRKDAKEKEKIMNVENVESFIETFYAMCSASWQKEDGSLDQEKVKEFYTQLKRIYDTKPEGNEGDSMMLGAATAAGSMAGNDVVGKITTNSMDLLDGGLKLNAGVLTSMRDLAIITSINKQVNGLNYKELQEGDSKVFVPRNILGINSKSNNMDAAKSFLSYLMSKESQSIDQGGGFAVNRTAFEAGKEEAKGTDGGMASIGVDGNLIKVDLVWPTEEEFQTLLKIVEGLDTPSLTDAVIKNVITEQAAKCLEGSVTVEEAVNNVMQKANLYLAE